MKPLFVISCPFDTYSGYGARSRDLVKSIIEKDQFEVKLLSQRWGSTPFNFCNDHPEWKFLLDYKLTSPNLPKKPEIWMQISVPNEFQPIGEYNIGVTAGMETTLVDGTWIEGINRMDLNLVSSEHSKKSFLNSVYERQNQQGVNLGKVEVEKPIEVLFEGVDVNTYFPIEKNELPDISLVDSLNEIPEQFCYLYVGHWLPGILGEDRKNTGLLVKAFLETFKSKSKKPALILKTASGPSSYMDRDEMLNRIQAIKSTINSKNLPKIYLLHGEFSNEEMNVLYNHPKVKAMVNLTKGEGFGRPLLEFTQCKKPLITTNWSGHTDFLDPMYTLLINGTLTKVHQSSVIPNMILPEAEWFSPNHPEIGHYLKDVFTNYKKYTDKAKRQSYHCKTNFSWEKMSEKLYEILDENLPKFSSQVELKLPELNLPTL